MPQKHKYFPGRSDFHHQGIVESNYCTNIKISMFADKYFFSQEYLNKLFKNKYGYTIYEYVLKLRMERAKELLGQPDIKIMDIAERLGYADNHYFSKAFRTYYHVTPTQYRNQLQNLKGSARVSIPAFRFLRGLPMCNTEYNANVPFASAAFDTCDRESPLHPHSLSAATRLFLPFLLRYRRFSLRHRCMHICIDQQFMQVLSIVFLFKAVNHSRA